MKKIACLIAAGLIVSSAPLFANPVLFGEWQAKYPESKSDDNAGCQLCHLNPGGNQPWNSYGFDLRTAYRANSFDFDRAMDLVQFTNSDESEPAADNLEEILANFQPGWADGATNTVYWVDNDENVTTSENLEAPQSAGFEENELDFPQALSDLMLDPIQPGALDLDLYEVAGDLNAPLAVVRAPGINGSLFVAEQGGKIFRIELASGEKTLFHDVSADLVSIDAGYDERGLLGLAFHPDFASNGLFYTHQSEPVRETQDSTVDFTTIPSGRVADHRTMVVEYQASDASCNSPIRKLDTLMIVDQPQLNHNGGDLAFGPDGYLYIALGDGGGANDQGLGHGLRGNARDTSTVLGSILRIDPLGENSANGKYGIPDDNPFSEDGDDAADEIFAYGLRNPFRMSFDAVTGELYAGDVGQNDVEEIDLIVKGGNYGWNFMEGSFYFYNVFQLDGSGGYVSDIAPPDAPQDLILPIAEYGRDDGISVTGGYVYRGEQISALEGKYVFADYFTKRFFQLDENNDIQEITMMTDADFIAGFGEDVNNELYVVTNDQFNISGVQGKLLRLTDVSSEPSFPDAGDETAMCDSSGDDSTCIPIKAANGAVALVCL